MVVHGARGGHDLDALDLPVLLVKGVATVDLALGLHGVLRVRLEGGLDLVHIRIGIDLVRVKARDWVGRGDVGGEGRDRGLGLLKMGGRQVSPLAGGDGGKKTQIGWQTFFANRAKKKKKGLIKCSIKI